MKAIIVLCLVALAFSQTPTATPAPTAGAAPAAPAKAQANVTEITIKDSANLMRLIQGINETTVWIIQFHDNDQEDGFTQAIKDELKNNPTLKDVSYQKLDYKVASIDVNNKQFEDALQQLGMTSNQFQATFPVALVMRKRKGVFAWGYDLAKAVSERLAEVADGKTDPYE